MLKCVCGRLWGELLLGPPQGRHTCHTAWPSSKPPAYQAWVGSRTDGRWAAFLGPSQDRPAGGLEEASSWLWGLLGPSHPEGSRRGDFLLPE